MFSLKKISLIFFALWLSFNVAFTQPSLSVRWYESFFVEKDQEAVEKALAATVLKLNETLEIHDLLAESKLRLEIGLIHLNHTHNYEQAMDNFIQSLALADSLKVQSGQIFAYIAIAEVFEKVGDYYKSAEFFENALAMNRQLMDRHVQALILNKLGKINASIGRMDEAFATYQQVLENIDESGQEKVASEAVFNLAHLYMLQGEYDKALEHHKHALALRRYVGDRSGESLSLNDIGELYSLMKNDERAMANHEAALEISRSLKDQKGVANAYNSIGVLLYRQKNIPESIGRLNLALQAAQAAQSQDQIRKSYEYLSLGFSAQNDFKKALEYKDLYLAINDFIQRERTELQLLETQNRYVVDQKQSQIRRLESIRAQREKELQEQMRFRNFLFAIIALGVVIVLLVIYLYLTKRRSSRILEVAHARVQEQNIQLRDLNATKDKFFSIISHDLKGPLNSLTSFSGLLINHTDSLSKDEIKTLARDLDKSLKNLFALLDNLLEWSRSQTGNIQFKPETFDLVMVLEENKTLLETQAQNKNITIKIIDNDPAPVHAHRNSINTVVRNLISNAIKFTPAGGAISLRTQHREKEIVVSVSDTGVGMSPEVLQKIFRIDTKHSTKGTADEKGTGLGLILCRDFVEKNGGTIRAESVIGKGSVFYFTLPRTGSAHIEKNPLQKEAAELSKTV